MFHYNGHGVPRPTENGEIWVFNKGYTQYIPISLFDLQTWMVMPRALFAMPFFFSLLFLGHITP